MTTTEDALADLLAHAKRAGADDADAMLIRRTSLSVDRRLGRSETLERAESRDLGLRVFVGQKAAGISVSHFDRAQFATIAERAVAMARIVPDDPNVGLNDAARAPDDAAGLDLDDSSEPTLDDLILRADAAEAAAMAVPGVTNSEGGGAGYGRRELFLLTSRGFVGRVARSSHSISASVLAGTGTGMQRDHDHHSAVHLSDLDAPDLIGRRAGERAVARLNPARPQTARLPVIFSRRVAGSLIDHLLGAINGAGIVRGTSFLKNDMDRAIFDSHITVYDDPRRVRGLRSGTFDGEGVATAPRRLIEDGVLRSWILDGRSAKILGLAPTGHAGRAPGGVPSPMASNVYLAPGTPSPDELIGDVSLGLYVTELIGHGVNAVTGDYSRGASGFMIRQGKLAEPVAELTIASNLRDMFLALTAANDLEFRRGTDAPTVRIAQMTLAGAD